jgi:benzoyl-CoA 2,3-dioxygenase component A
MVVIKQHLIDPESCIRCNTCEATCPSRAITHDARNYVVDVAVCNGCLACISPCPTGAIDNWRTLPKARAYSLEEQLSWDALPVEQTPAELDAEPGATEDSEPSATAVAPAATQPSVAVPRLAATLPPRSAAHPYTNLYTPKHPATAKVLLNARCTEPGFANESHHIVLDFGVLPFPVLEGQSLGIVPPGVDARGRPHPARLYSVASPRSGEYSIPSSVALTVKRVVEDCEGRPVRGVASNHLCDLAVGDTVQVIGPFGTSFLMPNHARSNLIMICTGTGSAPMRAMTERRRKLLKSGNCPDGKLLLFFGARTQQELPYFGPLQSLSQDFIDVNIAYSRAPGMPKRYVQDLMRERARELGALLQDPETYIYVCGITRMEEGVLGALRDAAEAAGMSWETLSGALQREGRLHLETY